MDSIDEVKEMEQALAKMTDHQRDHLRIVIKELVYCYLHEDRHGLVLLGGEGSQVLKIIAVNTTDMDASSLLSAADSYINFKVMEEAPPKEMFN